MVGPMKVVLAACLVLTAACSQEPDRVALTGLPSTTTTHPPSTTTQATETTVAARKATVARSTPSTPPATVVSPTTSIAPLASGDRVVSSTNYCLRGTMANGQPVHDGAVAVNSADWPRYRGTSWYVVDGEFAGRVFTVEDHGPGADFDIWVSSCPRAEAYGRHRITVRPA